jgi:spermidine synthase
MNRRLKQIGLPAAAAAALVVAAVVAAVPESRHGPLVHEVRSEYSHIRLRQRGSLLALLFVRDSGEEVVESVVNLRRPQDLELHYTRAMFASHLFRPEPRRVLILGLGGGAMVHFLKHHQPDVKVNAVDIDPVVVRLADERFGVRSEGNVRITTGDAFVYVRQTDERYDVIYLDAYLKPSADTDATGVPLRLKTLDFYKQLREKLADDGLAVFNLNVHDRLDDDLATIGEAFPQVYVFRVWGNVVAVGSTSPDRVPVEALRRRALELDRRLQANFSFAGLLRSMAEEREER